MTPKTHLRGFYVIYFTLKALSLVVVVVVGIGLALAGAHVFAKRGWFAFVNGLLEDFGVFGVCLGLFVIFSVAFFLLFFVWSRIRPACERCGAAMKVAGYKPITYECSGCKNRVRTKTSVVDAKPSSMASDI